MKWFANPCVRQIYIVQYLKYQGIHTLIHVLSFGIVQPRSRHGYTCRKLDDLAFHKIADETLDELAEVFDELGDSGICPEDYDSNLAVSVVLCTLY